MVDFIPILNTKKRYILDLEEQLRDQRYYLTVYEWTPCTLIFSLNHRTDFIMSLSLPFLNAKIILENKTYFAIFLSFPPFSRFRVVFFSLSSTNSGRGWGALPRCIQKQLEFLSSICCLYYLIIMISSIIYLLEFLDLMSSSVIR